MLVGEPKSFAIESEVTEFVPHRSQIGLGCFNVHVAGHRFGVMAPDASMLGCSYAEVGRRLQRRGTHRAAVAFTCSADSIATLWIAHRYPPALVGPEPTPTEVDAVAEMVANHTDWAPDGDEAFDDGSHVLQFDLEESVRLVGFRTDGTWAPRDGLVADAWIPAGDYYEVLREWRERFELAWLRNLRGNPDSASP